MSLFKYFRHCALCHCWPNSYSEILCKNCWNFLASHSPPHLRSYNYPFPVYRLWQWAGTNSTLRSFLYALKGGWASESFSKLSFYFLRKKKIDKTLQQAVIVPCPRAHGAKTDHALTFAKHLSELSSIPFSDVLSRKLTARNQKENSMDQRGKVRMNLLQTKSLKNVIFVDDVITSGATALAGYKALGSPEKFQVWVLSERLKMQVHLNG